MTVYAAKQANDSTPALTASQAGDVLLVPFTFLVGTALADTDIVKLCKLPAQHLPVDCLLDVPDLDTGTPAIVFDLGFYENDATPTVVDIDAMVAASTAGQAGGLVRATAVAYLAMAASNADRLFALTVTTGPGTGATAVTIRGWLAVRPVSSYD